MLAKSPGHWIQGLHSFLRKDGMYFRTLPEVVQFWRTCPISQVTHTSLWFNIKPWVSCISTGLTGLLSLPITHSGLRSVCQLTLIVPKHFPDRSLGLSCFFSYQCLCFNKKKFSFYYVCVHGNPYVCKSIYVCVCIFVREKAHVCVVGG